MSIGQRRPAFIGAALTAAIGNTVAACVDGLHAPPPPPRLLDWEIGGRAELVPYQLMDGVPREPREDRLLRVLETVIGSALREAGLAGPALERTWLFVGSSSFDIAAVEALYQCDLAQKSGELPLTDASFANVAEWVRQRFGLRGEDFSFNTACTASANALWYATRAIEAGWTTHALVVGVELINSITAQGFHSLGLLTRSGMRPFDRCRDGLVLGEACSALVLGPAGDPGTFRLAGGANLCDAYSMSAANPDGSTAAAVMAEAIDAAGLRPRDIDGIKAHGTASLLNDEAEAAGLLRVFQRLPPVCALKPFVGHTLGACGLVELILMYRALAGGVMPATPGIGADPSVLGVSLTQAPGPARPGNFLLNYFGFGGSNTCLVIANGANGAVP